MLYFWCSKNMQRLTMCVIPSERCARRARDAANRSCIRPLDMVLASNYCWYYSKYEARRTCGTILHVWHRLKGVFEEHATQKRPKGMVKYSLGHSVITIERASDMVLEEHGATLRMWYPLKRVFDEHPTSTPLGDTVKHLWCYLTHTALPL